MLDLAGGKAADFTGKWSKLQGPGGRRLPLERYVCVDIAKVSSTN